MKNSQKRPLVPTTFGKVVRGDIVDGYIDQTIDIRQRMSKVSLA